MQIRTLLLDIDGVVNNKGSLIPGMSELLRRIVDNGITIKFVTNCSLHKLHHFDEKIIPGFRIEIIDPIYVLKDLAEKGSFLNKGRSIVIGTKEIRHRISEIGIEISDSEDVDVVFIFEKLNYDQAEITHLSRSVLNGARLYSAGLDRLFWYQGNVFPGVGAIAEQVKFMTQADITVLGKPSKIIFDLALKQVADVGNTLFVGDDFHIDILGAKNCGLMTAYLTNNHLGDLSLYKPYADFIDVDLKNLIEKIL